ncbi:MAG: J domain-containing protein [Ilumatobacteraceae bacterium]
MPTHYDTLGIRRDASPEEIRLAYRARARAVHPDRLAGGGVGGAVDMAAVNEAYRVLGDPGRRALYDRSLGGPTRIGPVDPSPSRTEEFAGPATFPWKLLAVMGTIGISFVLVSAALTEGDPARVPDGIIESGSCVGFEQNGDVREVGCTGDAAIDRVVRVLVPLDARCPVGTEAHRDRLGLGVACLVP